MGLDYSGLSIRIPRFLPFWGWFRFVFDPRASLWYQRIAPLRPFPVPVSPLDDVYGRESNLGL